MANLLTIKTHEPVWTISGQMVFFPTGIAFLASLSTGIFNMGLLTFGAITFYFEISSMCSQIVSLVSFIWLVNFPFPRAIPSEVADLMTFEAPGSFQTVSCNVVPHRTGVTSLDHFLTWFSGVKFLTFGATSL